MVPREVLCSEIQRVSAQRSNEPNVAWPDKYLQASCRLCCTLVVHRNSTASSDTGQTESPGAIPKPVKDPDRLNEDQLRKAIAGTHGLRGDDEQLSFGSSLCNIFLCCISGSISAPHDHVLKLVFEGWHRVGVCRRFWLLTGDFAWGQGSELNTVKVHPILRKCVCRCRVCLER